MRFFFVCVLLSGQLAVAGLALAEEGPANSFLPGFLERGGFESYKLPGADLILVQSGNLTYLTTPNARYLIRGQLYDTWNGRFIQNVSEAKALGDKIQLSRIPINIDRDLKPFYLGQGKENVVAFIDPHCPYCHKLLKQMEALGKDYRFTLILIPALGDRSAQTIRLLRCGTPEKDRNQQVVSRLIRAEYQGLEDAEDCDLEPFLKSAILARILGIQGVPFLIAPDGRVLRGYVEDLKGFLEEKKDASS